MDTHQGFTRSFKSLIWGFILSIAFTLVAFVIAMANMLSGWPLVLTVMGLASVQALIQLVLFMHLGDEEKPHWYLISFLFMFIVLVVLVGGSMWIMNNLNYNVMTSAEHMEVASSAEMTGLPIPEELLENHEIVIRDQVQIEQPEASH
ncbi:MAG: cytochrome o ubiquinol oxidase subunit IV [Simkaniaceae bacterium]|nr:cytochrome o ubiquinol oxidase subunit IV [Simkaniaceae bacterium]